jgi:monofunctional biosynthetic peptidoglycan transglycosylase
MIIRGVEQIFHDSRDFRLQAEWTSLTEMSPWFVRAAIASEDQNFEKHRGFDWEAIEKAREFNKRSEGKRVRGASTISQQLAKNLFLWPARSWFRKGLEVWFTFLIELLWSKERIIEVYLNVIEMGDGIYGVGAASDFYFSKSAQSVSKDQAVSIIACLPSPLRWSPIKPGKFVRWKKAWIVRQMNNLPNPTFLD